MVNKPLNSHEPTLAWHSQRWEIYVASHFKVSPPLPKFIRCVHCGKDVSTGAV